MLKFILLALRGNFIKAMRPTDLSKYTVADIVRAKKEMAGIDKTTNYDMNEDGVVDDEDLRILRRIVLENS